MPKEDDDRFPLAPGPAHRADGAFGDPRDPEAHRAARHHLAGRRPAVARQLSGRGDAGRLRARAARNARARRCSTRRARATGRCANGSPRISASRACASMRRQVLDHHRLAAGPRPRRQGADRRGLRRSPSSRRPTSARCRPSRRTSREVPDGRLRRRRAAARGARRRWPGARFLYVLPNFQNPSGRCIGEARRAAIASAGARRCGLPLVEDNPYGDLWFDAPPPASLASRWPEGTVYLGSFSKVLAPGLRLGYVVAPPELFPKLLQAKQAADLHTPGFNQRVVHEVIKDGFLRDHVPTIRARYSAQRDAMASALERHLAGPAAAAGPCRKAACSSGSSCPKASTRRRCCRTRCDARRRLRAGRGLLRRRRRGRTRCGSRS